MKKLTSILIITLIIGLSALARYYQDNEYTKYNENLEIEGINGITINREILSNQNYLVAKKMYEDHVDYILFPVGTREKYFKQYDEVLPGNIIGFQGKIEAVDGAAGSHYYEVKKIKKLNFIEYPEKETVLSLLENYKGCNTDNDCIDYYPGCPLGCSTPINKNQISIVTDIVDAFINNKAQKCDYKCIVPEKISCENYQCTAIYENNTFKEDTNDKSNNGIEENNPLNNEDILETTNIFN